MTDKRDKALEWIERQIRQTRQALGRAEYKPGVKSEELENLRAKIELLEFISGALLRSSKPQASWFSVKENPPGYGFVFAYVAPFATVEIAKYKGDLWRTQESRRALNADWVTHWMPLPEPPKEE